MGFSLRSGLVFFMLLLYLSLPPWTLAADPYKILVNNTPLQTDTSLRLENGRLLVPLRAVAEAMTAVVEWDEKKQTITVLKDRNTVVLTVNDATAFINGQAITLDAPARIFQGRTSVPLRFFAEALEASVGFDGLTKTARITYAQPIIRPPKDDGLTYRTLTFPNGDIYQGETQNGVMHGKGTLTYAWPDGKKYVGDFVLGEIQGTGVMNFPDGSQYRGEFYNGLMHGSGRYIWYTGRIDEGIWHMGRYIGTY